MKLLDVIKRAILEGKLDKELGITDGDVMKRFDKVLELIDKPIQLSKFEPYKDLAPVKWTVPSNPIPFDANRVWCSTQNTTFDKDFYDKYSEVVDVKEELDNEKN